MLNINRLLVTSITFSLLVGCGGSGSTTELSESEEASVGEVASSDDDTSSDDDISISGDIETLTLDFATVSSTPITLLDNKPNAREVYQLAHYIGRTEGQGSEGDIDIPIRSYTASCDVDTDTPKMFVSVTLANGTAVTDATFGSVYELAYNSTTKGFEATGNNAVLNQCYESHGIAVSPDCSRIAVLCNAEYQAGDNYEITKDLIEENVNQYNSGTWLGNEDNKSQIDERINSDLGLMLATNHSSYLSFFTDHDTLTISDFLAGLQENFPDENFDESTTFSTLKGNTMAEEMAYVASQLSETDLNNLTAFIQEVSYKTNDQVWLLEWNNQALSETPDSYVVNKMHGGTHLGVQELVYVDDDSEGNQSYGFSVSSRVFDDEGDSHYSAAAIVVERSGDDWVIPNLADIDSRGWYWACQGGHVIHSRSFYNPYSELYGTLCTSDGNSIGNTHGDLGSIGVKQASASYISEGSTSYYVPSTTAMVTNGGGHTVVPVDSDTNISVIVAPKLISDESMTDFYEDMFNTTLTDTSQTALTDLCWSEADYYTCFKFYMDFNKWENNENVYPSIELQNLYSGDALDSTSLTRIGLAKLKSGGTAKEEYHWIVGDDDCQYSDPQLVNLQNGRFFLGYAKFQCISDGLSYHRTDTSSGSMRMLVPKTYYAMEIDSDYNILSGPVALGDKGWGGLDEPSYLGAGKVGWTYLNSPTIDNYSGGQSSEWQAVVYESNQ